MKIASIGRVKIEKKCPLMFVINPLFSDFAKSIIKGVSAFGVPNKRKNFIVWCYQMKITHMMKEMMAFK